MSTEESEVSKEEPIDIDATTFAVTSLSLLNSSRLNNSQCDFTIIIGEEHLTVHKNVLATRSEYFEAMFRSNTSETKTAKVEMRNVDSESVKKCIEYIYTGKASVKQENIEKLLHVAHMMTLKELCSAIGKLLEKLLNHVTFFMTKRLAHTYDCSELEEKCDAFALINCEAVSTEVSFTNLEKDYLVQMLSSTTLIASESVKLNAIRKWIHKNIEERKIFFKELLEFVKVSKLPTRYFHSILQNEPLIYDSASILRKFSMTMLKATATKTEAIAVYNTSKHRFQILEHIGVDNLHLTASEFLGQQIQDLFDVVSSPNTLYVLKQNKEMYGLDYNEPSSEWRKLPSMQQDHAKPLTVYHKEIIYVIDWKGREKFCISSNTWSSMGNLPNISYQAPGFQQNYYNTQVTSRNIADDSAIAAWDGHIYVVGGKLMTPNFNQFYAVTNIVDYNCSTNTWSAANFQLGYARYNAVATTCGDVIYVIGGMTDNNQQCSQTEIISMPSMAHSYVNQSTHPVINAFATGQTIFVLGGEQKRVATAIDSKTRSVSSSNINGAEVDQLDYRFAAAIRIL